MECMDYTNTVPMVVVSVVWLQVHAVCGFTSRTFIIQREVKLGTKARPLEKASRHRVMCVGGGGAVVDGDGAVVVVGGGVIVEGGGAFVDGGGTVVVVASGISADSVVVGASLDAVVTVSVMIAVGLLRSSAVLVVWLSVMLVVCL